MCMRQEGAHDFAVAADVAAEHSMRIVQTGIQQADDLFIMRVVHAASSPAGSTLLSCAIVPHDILREINTAALFLS
ncbi:hypothetical protein C27AD_05453 [Salinisphaera hydrothermalis C27AD]